MTDNMIAWDLDADGVLTLNMDDPNQGANTMNELFQNSLQATAERVLAEADSITGIIFASGKSTFFAGGDLKMISTALPEQAAELEAYIDAMKAALRSIETLEIGRASCRERV